jgi:hypothetical protein
MVDLSVILVYFSLLIVDAVYHMGEQMIAKGDLEGGTPGDWLVVGWFTEDDTYRPLAEAFAAQLSEHGAPFHLWAKPSLGAWNTRRKPAVVLQAMNAYPGKTVILMDCDCLVRGDISPMLAGIDGDIGITVTARNAPKGSKGRMHWVTFETSSRVIVFRPTAGARAFAEEWARQIESATYDHDEFAMAWAYLHSPDVAFSYIPRDYSGREVTVLPDAIVAHDSAHGKQRKTERGIISSALRTFERRFLRTGRTRRAKQHLQSSVTEAVLQ